MGGFVHSGDWLGTPGPYPASGLFSLADLTPERITALAARSAALFRDPGAHDRPLAGRTAGILFICTSTRTRTAFTVAAVQLGAAPIAYGPGDLQLHTGESLGDTGRVLGAVLDLLVARTAGPVNELKELSRRGGLPVVNAISAEEHLTQGLCDLGTLTLVHGDLSGIRLLYVGEGNNSAVALAHGLAAVPGARTVFATPPGYGVPDHELGVAGGSVSQVHDFADAPADADVVYTTRWQTTGTAKHDPDWREAFRPFHVDAAVMARWPVMADIAANTEERRRSDISGSAREKRPPCSIRWPRPPRRSWRSCSSVSRWCC